MEVHRCIKGGMICKSDYSLSTLFHAESRARGHAIVPEQSVKSVLHFSDQWDSVKAPRDCERENVPDKVGRP